MKRLEARMQQLSPLRRSWVQAEELCNSLRHRLDWTYSRGEEDRIEATLERARLRAERRYQKLQAAERLPL